MRGSVSLSAMTRLAGYLHDAEGSVDVELAFGIDEQGIKYAAGRMQTVLRLVCQRCLQSMTYPIDIETRLGLARTEDAARLPEGYEPLILEDSTVEVARIVEDELILALPIVPAHPPGECAVKAIGPVAEKTATDSSSDKRRPFAGLAELMKKQKQGG